MNYYRKSLKKKTYFEGLFFFSYLNNNVHHISEHDICNFFLLIRYDISCLKENVKQKIMLLKLVFWFDFSSFFFALLMMILIHKQNVNRTETYSSH